MREGEIVRKGDDEEWGGDEFALEHAVRAARQAAMEQDENFIVIEAEDGYCVARLRDSRPERWANMRVVVMASRDGMTYPIAVREDWGFGT